MVTDDCKKECVQKTVQKLKKIVKCSIRKGKFNKALSGISAIADIMYRFNQVYSDDSLEEELVNIGEKIVRINRNKYKSEVNEKSVLFYDSFGLNIRGIAIVYTKAIVLAGYKLIYVTNKKSGKQQPDLERELKGFDVEWVYIDTSSSYLKWIKEIEQAFNTYKPSKAFFYTTPFDVSGTIVFNEMRGVVTRYLIDLTDHAFWLGKNAADVFVGGRDVSASIAYYYRKIPVEKLAMLDVNLYINHSLEIEDFPFDVSKHRYIFSGGQLYKTLGDPENKYYHIIDEILTKNKDMMFVYAGEGDDSQICILEQKHMGRVFLLHERKDFYQIIENCTLYLNTYPMFGGLMMRYAANAGKLPITLRHNNDADGILINQAELGIEYDDAEQLIEDVDFMLKNEKYLHQREQKLIGSVMTETCFVRNVRMLIETKTTEFNYNIEEIDTLAFREEYYNRFDCKKDIVSAICKKINYSLVVNFPREFLKQIYYKVVKEK